MGKAVPGTFVSHEDAAAYRLKIDQSNVFWKNLALRICVPMGHKMDTQWDFSVINKNKCMELF